MEKEANFSPSLASTDDVMEGNAISESNRTVLHQQSIGKTLAQHRSYSILSLTAQLKAIEDHFNSAHASIQERAKDLDSMQESLKEKFKELETKEQELGRVQEELKRKEEELVKRIKGYGMKEEGLENAKGEDFIGTLVKTEAPDANRGGCVTIDGKWLQTYLKEHSEEVDLKRNEVEVVLRLSSDPAQLVLDAVEGFYSPCLMKGDVSFDGIVRRSCILLLELLFKISSEIKPGVKKKILRIASEWMKKMGKDSENSLWEVVANVGESLDGKWLQMYLNEHSEELDLIRSEVEVALRLSLDPAQVVLDAIKMFYPPYLMKGNVAFKEGTVRRSCILLLELLFEISPEITYCVKEEARRIAYQWMEKMRKDVEHSVEVFGFLKLVGSFGLTSAFDANELLNYLGVVAQPRQAPELFHLLGLADRKRSFVENLIRNNHQLEAIRFTYSLEMVHNFPPGPLLKDFLLQSHREARKFRKRSPCKRIAATEKRIFEIRDVLKCIEEFKIEHSPELSPKHLQNVISGLEREIANMKAMQLAVSAPNLALTPQHYPNFISTACPAAQVIVSSLSPTGHNPTTKFTLPSIAAPSSGPSSVSQTLSTTAPATVTSSSPAGQVSVSSSSSTGHKPATKFTFPSLSRPFSGTIFSSQSQPLSTTAPIMVTSSSPVAQVAVSSPSPTDHNPATKFTFPSVTSPFNDPIFSSSLRTLSTTAPNMVTSSSATQVTVPSLSPSDHIPATKFSFSSQTTTFKFNFPSQTAPFSGPMFSSTTTPFTVNSFSSLSKTLLTTAPVIVASSSPVAPSTAPITITFPFPTVTPASASTLMTQPKRFVKKRRPPRPKQGGRNKHARVVESAGLASTAGLALETLTSVSTASPAAQVTISSLSLTNNPTTKVVSPSQTATLSCPIVSSLSRALSTTAPIMVTSSPPATPSTALVTFTSLSPTCSPTSEATLVTQPQPLAIYNSPPRSQHRGRNRRARVGESVGLRANYGMSYHTPAVDYIWVPLYAPFEQRYSPYHMPFHYRRH